MTLGRLSRSARRALAGCAVLAALGGAAVVVQAWALAEVLAAGGALGVLAGAVLARALLTWATQVVAARAAAGAKEELRARLLDRALALGPEWTVPRGAELTVLATRGLDALDAYFTVYLPALVNAAVFPLGVGAVLLVADWPSALVVAVTLPLVPLFAALVGLRTRDRVREAAATEQRVAHHLRELVRVRPVLTAFRRAAAQAETIRRLSETQRRSTMATLRVAFASALALELVATLSVALVAVLVGIRLVNGDLSLAVGLFVLILAPECYLPLRSAGAAHHASEAGLETVRAIAALPTPTATGTLPPSGDLRVTAPLPFTARPGEIVHLNTPSASGKSRTFAAVLGFAPGRVQVGETELSDVDIEAWRRMVAWVPQHPKFTGGTVAAELGGQPAPELGITHLLDRTVDQLSTGERQRVAIARALLRNAKVLLLDEPTAHLDPANAAGVHALIERAAANGAAVVLASHRKAAPTAQRGSSRAASVIAPARFDSLPLRTLLTPRLVAGAALGATALIAGVALTATSAWLIAKAATQPSIMTLGVAVVGVRAFGLARAGLRYAERLVTHDAAFRMAAVQRVRAWHTAAYERLTTDVDTVRDLTPRVLLPPIVATLVCVAAVVVQTAILPSAGLALTIAVAAAGLGAPAVALAVDRRATRALSAGRREVATRVLTLLDAAPDLIAFGRHHQHRTAIAVADATLAGKARRQALSAGAASALITVAMGTATVTSIWLAAGVVDPLLLPVLALVPLALTETLLTLPAAAQHLAPLRAAHTTPHLPSNVGTHPTDLAPAGGGAGDQRSAAGQAASHPRPSVGACLADVGAGGVGGGAGDQRSTAGRTTLHLPPSVAACLADVGAGGVGGSACVRCAAAGQIVPHPAPNGVVVCLADLESGGVGGGAGDQRSTPGQAVPQPPPNCAATRLTGLELGGVGCGTGDQCSAAGRAAPQPSPDCVAACCTDLRSGDVSQSTDGQRSAAGQTAPPPRPNRVATCLANLSATGPTNHTAPRPLPNRTATSLSAPGHAVSQPPPNGVAACQAAAPCPVAALRHVDVRWPGADTLTLRDLTIDIPSGAHLAVTGPSGVGKSTLLALLCGLLPAERGTVRLPRTAWCPQEPHLAATSLRENLRVGDPTATDEQLRVALRAAALDTWTDRLDDDPTTASGGEAQRVAIARALLADADLLLLDEPTAHLDVATASRILANLKGRTVVHVTHRPDEAACADAVLELA